MIDYFNNAMSHLFTYYVLRKAFHAKQDYSASVRYEATKHLNVRRRRECVRSKTLLKTFDIKTI